MRVQVIGCGSIGRRHIGNLLALGCEVYACDPSAAARERTAEAYPAVDVWKGPHGHEDLDAVVIATPVDTHLSWVEQAVRYQKPFFVEKPLGTLEQLPRWRELAAMELPVNQVGYQLRFHQQLQRLRAFNPTPEYGACRCLCDWRTWPGEAYGEGLLECSHEIDLALVLGAAAAVQSVERTPHTVSFRLGHFRVDLDWESPVCYLREWSCYSIRAQATVRFTSPDELGDEMYYDEMECFVLRAAHPPNIAHAPERIVYRRWDFAHLSTLRDGLRVLEVCQQVEQLTRQPA